MTCLVSNADSTKATLSLTRAAFPRRRRTSPALSPFLPPSTRPLPPIPTLA